jgi:hypothetical protein
MKMRSLMADERGRITLGAKIIEEYGKRFAVVRHRKDIVLVPLPEDPLATLRKLWKGAGIDKYSAKELKKMAREEAEKEAVSNVRRH